eukprot:475477-Hanusia_phi.AAC.1
MLLLRIGLVSLVCVQHVLCSASVPSDGIKQRKGRRMLDTETLSVLTATFEEAFDEHRGVRPEFIEMQGSTGHPLRFLPVNSSRA